jgi:hypothetical protein
MWTTTLFLFIGCVARQASSLHLSGPWHGHGPYSSSAHRHAESLPILQKKGDTKHSTQMVQLGAADGAAGTDTDTNSNFLLHGPSHNLAQGATADFDAIEVLNLAATDVEAAGFRGGFTDGVHGYVVPYNNGVFFGKVIRFLLSDFNTVGVLNLEATDGDLKGFWGGFTDGVHGYVVPHSNGAYFGKVVRFLLSDFNTVEVLNLEATDGDLKGFAGGFTDGAYGYVVPYNNGAYFGKVARFLLSDFNSVEVLNLEATDGDLKGFFGGFTDGAYGYCVPFYNGGYSGKVARFLLSDFNSVEVLNLEATDGDVKGFVDGFTDGAHGYVVPYYNGAYFGKVVRFQVTPTVAGPDGGAAAVGDPHLQNVHGERFDLMKEGKHVLISIPRGQDAQHALLRVQADARRLGGNCADLYFKEANVTGAWAEAKNAGGYHYSVSQNDIEAPEWVAFGKVELKVVHGRTDGGLPYLNVYMKHLRSAGVAVGGLLGEDDHEDVITPPEACTRKMALGKGQLSGQIRASASSVAMATFGE